MTPIKTTRWSMVLTAQDTEHPESRAALEELCRVYWFPLYSYVRSRGYGREQAEDLTQEFFIRFVDTDFLRKADRNRGRFRSFLLTSLGNFLHDEWDKGQAQKRGGGAQHLSLDFVRAEGLHAEVSAGQRTPEELYDCHWAKTLLARALARLESECASTDNEELFAALRPYLGGPGPSASYSEVGETLGMKAGAVKVAVHRMRKRYRGAVEQEIMETLADPDDLKQELDHLMSALSG